ncbi:hypothetical protein ABH935_007795 [Catenulispora sp. GAS73]|uniref:replication-relaxation family protein n=1 Tax=Catenulispora sp. GAS73 TaxID=3156269 RepID=UPI00351459BE
MSRRRSPSGGAPSQFALAHAAKHLTERDRDLLTALAVHRVLTAPQLTEIGFGSPTTARHRLQILCEQVKVIARFRPFAERGSNPYHYVLTPLGAHVVAVQHGEAEQTEKYRSRARRDADLAVSPGAQLKHTLGVAGLYASLKRAERQSGGAAALACWRTERHYNPDGRSSSRVIPDAVGCFTERVPAHPGGVALPRRTWFVVEYDTGTEKHEVLLAKLNKYGQLLGDGFEQEWEREQLFCWPHKAAQPAVTVLLVFASPLREQNVRAALLDDIAQRGLRKFGVATAVYTPGVDAAGPIWQPLGSAGLDRARPPRLRLSALDASFAEEVKRHQPRPAPSRHDIEAAAEFERAQDAAFGLDDDAEAA